MTGTEVEMLLTITTTREPATGLGFLLHKHPDRVKTFPLTSGKAHVFYTEACTSRCTAAFSSTWIRLDSFCGGAIAEAVPVVPSRVAEPEAFERACSGTSRSPDQPAAVAARRSRAATSAM